MRKLLLLFALFNLINNSNAQPAIEATDGMGLCELARNYKAHGVTKFKVTIEKSHGHTQLSSTNFYYTFENDSLLSEKHRRWSRLKTYYNMNDADCIDTYAPEDSAEERLWNEQHYFQNIDSANCKITNYYEIDIDTILGYRFVECSDGLTYSYIYDENRQLSFKTKKTTTVINDSTVKVQSYIWENGDWTPQYEIIKITVIDTSEFEVITITDTETTRFEKITGDVFGRNTRRYLKTKTVRYNEQGLITAIEVRTQNIGIGSTLPGRNHLTSDKILKISMEIKK